MNNIDLAYQALLQDILDNGVEKKDRTGTGTISVFGRQIRHKMSDGFPLLTTKKMYFKGIVTELLWFLRGDTNIKYLVDNDCHIWDGDAYKNYEKKVMDDLKNWDVSPPSFAFPEHKEEFINKIKTDSEFAKKWGELGPIYGKQWREWSNYRRVDSVDEVWSDYRKEDPIDQIANLINDLKSNPDSRRLMVNSWNCSDLDSMVLPPCHYGFQVYTRELSLEERVYWLNKNYPMYDLGEWTIEKLSNNDYLKEVEYEYNIPKRAISLMFNQRSVDTFLGLPFNIASYGLLLEIIAKEVNMVPDELIGNLGDVHLYSNHVEQAKEQIGRELTVEERVKLYEVKTNTDTSFFPVLSETLDFHNIPKRTREPYPLPQVRISSGPLDDIAHHEINDFELLNYQSHPPIKAPLSN